jgi:hypothetical protein
MTISDDLLLAYIDGELSREDRARVDAAVATDPEVAQRLRRHQAIGSRIHGAFAGVAEEPAPEALVRMIKPAAAVVSLQAARARKAEAAPKPGPKAAPKRALPPIDARWGAIAAALVVGLGVGLFAPRPQTGLIDAKMRAAGPLEVALNGKLASQPATAGDVVRIGLTVRDGEGRWCRTFTSKDGLAGVGCRQGEEWAVRMAQTGAPFETSDFRRAASETPPAVLTAVEGLIAGEPVDAAAEKTARAAGWR